MEVTFIIEPFPFARTEAKPLPNFSGTKKFSSNIYYVDLYTTFFESLSYGFPQEINTKNKVRKSLILCQIHNFLR